MNDTHVTQTKEFVFQRLSEPFPLSSPETPWVVTLMAGGGLLLFAALTFLVPLIRSIRGLAAGLLLRGLVWASLAYAGTVVWLGLASATEDPNARGQLFLGMLLGQAVLALLFGVSALSTLLYGGREADDERRVKGVGRVLLGVVGGLIGGAAGATGGALAGAMLGGAGSGAAADSLGVVLGVGVGGLVGLAAGVLLGLTVLLFLVDVLTGRYAAGRGNTEGIVYSTLLTVLFGRADTGRLSWWHFATCGCRAMLYLIPLLCMGVSRVFETDTDPVWWFFAGSMLYTACALTCLMYLKDSQAVSGWGVLFLITPFAVSPLFVWAAHRLTGTVGWVTAVELLAVNAAAVGLLALIRPLRRAGLGAWAKMSPMAGLRCLTLAALTFCFLLPAMQPWETSEKHSRVVLMIDESPSMVAWSDDISRDPNAKLKTRMDKVLDFLTADDGKFMADLLARNPVYVYRFGASLDPEPGVLAADDKDAKAKAWSRDEWDAFVKYDFKAWVLGYKGPDGGLSDDAKDKLRAAVAWNGAEAGTGEWAMGWAKAADADAGIDALADGADGKPNDKKVVAAVREKLTKRVDMARTIAQGTAVPEAVTAVVNREQANMTQAVIVFTDGRSNMSSDAAIPDLTRRAKEANIPVYTVAVGSAREVVSLAISDLQAPDRAQPDEPTQVTVAVDGVGFKQGDEVQVTLELFLPGKDPKNNDAADYEMTLPVKFGAGELPHGEATFVLDAEEFAKKNAASLIEEISPPKPGRKWQLKKGTWKVRAKVPTDPREVFREAFHLSPVRTMEVIDKPLRILLAASAPGREYQILRTLLVREVEQKRAELSIYLQNEGGSKGVIVQDVPPGRLLLKFPDELDVSKETSAGGGDPGSDAETARQRAKYNNLNEYDLIICFDPDWNEKDDAGAYRIQDGAFTKLKTWVQTLGGGLVYVAGPFYTGQLVRQGGESARLKPILDILPVEPDDIVASADPLITINGRKTPRRLKLNPPADSDILRLDEDAPAASEKEKAVAGWERFFSGGDTPPNKTTQKDEYLNPRRGFFSYYPVKQVKPGLTPLAEFVNVDEKGQEVLRPFYAVSQSGAGRAAWLGSAEIYRLRQVPENGIAYYDKFWLQLARYASAKRNSGAKARGSVMVSKEIVAGTPIRVQTRVLQASGDPYPENEPDKPKMTIEQLDQNGNVTDRFGPFDVLTPAKLGQKFEGYYKGQVMPNQSKMKVDNPNTKEAYRYRVSVTKADLPEPLTGEFVLRSANPELDNTKPDLQALLDAASPTAEALKGEPDAGKRAQLIGRLGTTDDDVKQGRAKLAFALDTPERVKVIPELIRSQQTTPQNRGTVDPLWDDEYDPAADKDKLNPGWAQVSLFSTPLGSRTFHLRLWAPAVLLLALSMALTWMLRTRSDLPGLNILEMIGTPLVGFLFIPVGLALTLPPALALWAEVFGPAGDWWVVGLYAACGLAGLAAPVAYAVAGRHRPAVAGVILTLTMLAQALGIGLSVWYGNPFPVGYAVLALATTLCSEWTLRKLLRLA